MVYGKNVNFLLIKNSIDNSIIALYKLTNGRITNIFNLLEPFGHFFFHGRFANDFPLFRLTIAFFNFINYDKFFNDFF